MSASDPDKKIRLDKWVWAARFFKTRALAAEAINGGRVHVNGARSKPARTVRIGDMVRIRKEPYEFVVCVCGLSEKRGSATVACTLYEETEQSRIARMEVARELRTQSLAGIEHVKGRPTKKSRRQIIRFIRRED